MIYRYLARDPMGRVVTGELEAPTPERLLLELKGRALTLVRFEPVAAGLSRRISAPEPERIQAAPETGEEDLDGDVELPPDVESADPGDGSPGAPSPPKKGCSLSFSVIILLLYLAFQLMKLFR